MTKTRTNIPNEIATKILVESNRTCCACHVERLLIQIHHIDEDHNNNSPENLAVLCFNCHGQTHVSGGFSRKLNAEQVRLYKKEWLSQVKKDYVNRSEPERKETEKADYIEYEVIQSSICSYSNIEVQRNSWYCVGYIASSLLLLAASLAITTFFNEFYLFILFGLPALVAGLYGFITYSPFYKMALLTPNDEVDQFINRVYVHKDRDGNCTTYKKDAPCNFPKCQGRIEVSYAPPMENHKYHTIGCCNLATYLHTFTIDFNGIGYYKEMDFRSSPK